MCISFSHVNNTYGSAIQEWYGGSMAIRKPGPFSLIVLRFLTRASTSLSKMTALAHSVICAFQPARREKGKKELVPSLSGNHMWHFAYVPLFPMVTSIWSGGWEMQPVFCTAAYSTKNGGGWEWSHPMEGDKKGYLSTVLTVSHHCNHPILPYVAACSFPFSGLSDPHTTLQVMLLLMSFFCHFALCPLPGGFYLKYFS